LHSGRWVFQSSFWQTRYSNVSTSYVKAEEIITCVAISNSATARAFLFRGFPTDSAAIVGVVLGHVLRPQWP
jgi:hypothetical protein